ncbi:MAG: hypothetical protein HC851_18880 [Acaryochloris sp. RU_4_1]|nr:hypothetical protein [Acaryochloris sp. RU_4_1]NJR56340.1 hypothetical protein [Acaryochloris sp. CRU_2_0]
MQIVATKTIAQYGLHGVAEERCRQIVQATSYMGWGFPDTLAEIYDATFAAETD